MKTHGHETEIKLSVPSAQAAASLLERHAFTITSPRAFEANDVFDYPDHPLRTRGELLRLRESAGVFLLTYKGPALAGPHKSRQEIETELQDGASFRAILAKLGFIHTFRYEKYRTAWARDGEPGAATLDETPIGVYLELEGSPDWIDQTAARLGFVPADYITASYGSLYLDYCQNRGIEPSHMTF